MCSAYDTGQFTGDVPITLDAVERFTGMDMCSVRLIRRTDQAPVYLKGEGIATMRWGYERPKLGVVNNTRSENLDSPMWRESFTERRINDKAGNERPDIRAIEAGLRFALNYTAGTPVQRQEVITHSPDDSTDKDDAQELINGSPALRKELADMIGMGERNGRS
jgi:hypothetical protein